MSARAIPADRTVSRVSERPYRRISGIRYCVTSVRFCQLSRRVFDVADPFWNRLSGLHDLERDPSAFGESIATERGGDDLFVTTARTKEVAEFTMLATEAVGRVMVLEAAQCLTTSGEKRVPYGCD